MNIRLIQANQTIDLRSRVLRPGQPLEMCHYVEDKLITTFHLGIFIENQVVCNGTFIQQGHSHFPKARLPYRLRGMATDPQFQKKGLGSSLINHAFGKLEEKNSDLLWFNARISAEIFYQKLGFDHLNEIFDIPTIGSHKIMFRWLEY